MERSAVSLVRGGFAWPRDALALGLWAGLIALAFTWGAELRADGAQIALGAAPLFGSFDLDLRPGIAVAAATAALIIVLGPTLARRASWGMLLAACAVAALAWSATLALGDGVGGLNQPLEGPSDYLASVALIHSPGDFLASFTDRIDAYSTHVRSHPPGMALILYGLERAGLGGSWPAAWLILLAAASTSAAALLALRSVAGERAARRAAPFLILVPGAVWIATTADALFMAVGAWAVALLVLAVSHGGRRSDALALGGGLAFGVGCFLSFGLVLLALIPAAVAIEARRARPLVLGAVGAAAVAACFAAAGYWWLDGYAAAREQYLASIARSRPYDFFLVSNLAAFGLAAGPALAPALGRLRDRRVGLLVGATLGAVALADLSGMSKGEVERIWLAFLPWAMLATAALPERAAALRGLLAAQAACAIAIEIGVATVWVSRPDPILVVGGAGFVGSHIVDDLVGDGRRVRVLDLLHPSAHSGRPRYLNPEAEYVWGDLRDPATVAAAVRGVDAVSHQCAMVGLGLDLSEMPDYVGHNCLATAVLLAALAERGFDGRLVLAGSMVVYGEGRYRCPRDGLVAPPPRPVAALAAGEFEPRCPRCAGPLSPQPVTESAAPDPRSVYAATKLHQEHLCEAYGRESGARVISLRYHNVYGSRMPRDTPYAGVASIFRSALEAGRPPAVFEDGRQLRDFISVHDVARANRLALDAPAHLRGPINIASGEPRAVGELANALAAALAGPSPRVTGEFRLGDVRHVFAATERARERLGFAPAVGFEDGVREFAAAPQRDAVAY